MKNNRNIIRKFLRKRGLVILWTVLTSGLVLTVLLIRLGTVMPQAGPLERPNLQIAQNRASALYYKPLDLPQRAVQVVVSTVSGHSRSLAINRLSSVVFGLATIGLFAVLIKYWHGGRTALLATILFACDAWLLHISRLATTDVLYLWAIPLLLTVQLFMHKHSNRPLVFYGSIAICGLVLYIPGLVWLVILSLFWQRKSILSGWRRFNQWWQRLLYVLIGLIWLPLLISRLSSVTILRYWLGLPTHIHSAQIVRQLVFVPVHLLIRGPNDPQRWLGHAPLLDIVSLALVLSGMWFYVRHYRATRSHVIGSYLVVGTLLVGLGGSVGLSLLVPLLYVLAATGIAYLLHEWLHIFPINPIARNLGIGLMAVAVIASCSYNLRAYFVAWPHDRATLTAYQQSTSGDLVVGMGQNLLY
jgi:hypothetical protein